MRLVKYQNREMIPPAVDQRCDNMMPVQGYRLVIDENAPVVELSLIGQS